MSRSVLTPALCAVALMMAPPLPAQSAPEVFQRALRAERVEGDLEAAVRLYSQVVEMGDRALSARALLRLGESLDRIEGPHLPNAIDLLPLARAAHDRGRRLPFRSGTLSRRATGTTHGTDRPRNRDRAHVVPAPRSSGRRVPACGSARASA